MPNDHHSALSASGPDGGASASTLGPTVSAPAERERKLVVVARDQFDLWWQLSQALTKVGEVEVVLDRRQGGRWQWSESRQYEDRGRDRRGLSNQGSDLAGRAFQVFSRPAPRLHG
jgi:hypothetical protein